MNVYSFLNSRRKAIAGLLTPIIIYVAVKIGLDADPELAAGISAALTGFVVERTRNI